MVQFQLNFIGSLVDTVSDDAMGKLDLTDFTHKSPWKCGEAAASLKAAQDHTTLENSESWAKFSRPEKINRVEEKLPEFRILGRSYKTSCDLDSSERSGGAVSKADVETFLMKSSRQ